MKSMNRWTGLGNVGKDPEIKSTTNGTLVANFSLATSSPHKDSAGNWQDRTEWHSLVAFARTAEIVRDYVRKGAKLCCEGHIQTRSWEKDGSKHYRTEIIVDNLILLSYREDSGSAPSENRTMDPSGAITDDDQIPF